MSGSVLATRARLDRAVSALNALRACGGEAAEAAERLAEALFDAPRHLAVYGSLAPGRSNHGEVAPLGGAWQRGRVHGELHSVSSGAAAGYTTLRWIPSAPSLEVDLLRSSALVTAWPRLDAFEGSGYVRILVPVWSTDGLLAVANLYAARCA